MSSHDVLFMQLFDLPFSPVLFKPSDSISELELVQHSLHDGMLLKCLRVVQVSHVTNRCSRFVNLKVFPPVIVICVGHHFKGVILG